MEIINDKAAAPEDVLEEELEDEDEFEDDEDEDDEEDELEEEDGCDAANCVDLDDAACCQ